jgi:dynein heavy chain
VEFIDDIVVEGFFQAILHDLDFFLRNTEKQLKPTPFFQAQMLLMPPEIVFKPPLEKEAGDGFYDLVEEMLCGSFRVSAQMGRVAAHLDIADYQVISQEPNWDSEEPQKETRKSNTGLLTFLF